jgi:hypothetical protein
MPVIGITLNNISAKRLGDIPLSIQLGHKAAIIGIEEADLRTLGKKGLKIAFEFETDYSDSEKKKSFGEIKINGDIIFLAANTAELLLSWKKEKKLPDAVNLECINNVIKKCMYKAIILSDDVGLPAPCPIPFAQAVTPPAAAEKKK